jgi:poly(A) polymerase
MIRLLKFRARHEFDIDPDSKKALLECKNELIKSSPARILEELFRMLESGSSKPFFKMMHATGLLKLIFPSLSVFLSGESGKKIYQYLAAADQINDTLYGPKLERAILTSCLLYPILEREIQSQYIDKGHEVQIGHVLNLTSSLIKHVVTSSFAHFPKGVSATMGYIMSTQFRLTPSSGKRHYRTKILMHKEFPLALKFLKIRSLNHPNVIEPYTTWSKVYKHHRDQENPRGHHHPPPHKKEEDSIS